MNKNLNAGSVRLAGYAALGGTVIMASGMALWGASGTDLWAGVNGCRRGAAAAGVGGGRAIGAAH